MPLFNNVLAGAAGSGGAGGYRAERSLRFTPGDGAHLTKTFSSAGNRRTFTLSYWIKECGKGSSPSNNPHILWSGADVSTRGGIVHRGTGSDANKIYLFNQVNTTTNCAVWSNSLHRDFSAWKNIVWAVDTTQSTATNRVKLYINGVQETLNFVTTPAQNLELQINLNQEHRIGRGVPDDYGNYMLAEMHFIDGQQINPVDVLGEFDADTGVWNLIEYDGSYGGNGFHLDFSDNSGNAALGYDAAGSNNWTVNNLVAVTNTNSKGFKPVTYSGNGSARSITGLDFQPDLVWIKVRNQNSSSRFFDSVRGATKHVSSNTTDAENTASPSLTAFNSNGFSLGVNNDGQTNVNQSGGNYVAWCWKANGTASSNTDGTITANVSADDAYGFSIIQFLGNATSGASVGHGLSSAPELVIGKNRGGGDNWFVWFKSHSPSAQSFLKLNSDAAETQSQYVANNTAPSSSVITLGSDYAWNSSQSPGTILYAWRSISGFSKFGSYTGNGNTSGGGPRVDLGFKPAFLMVKGANVQSGWRIYDSARDPGGQFQKRLYANESNSESTNSTQYVNYDDTGFNVEASGSLSTYNVSGKTYVYMAFAQDPGADAIDSLLDSPSSYEASSGNNGGNYATLNPLDQAGSSTLSNGNLDVSSSGTGSSWGNVRATIGAKSGKYYAEYTCTASTTSPGQIVGVVSSTVANTGASATNVALNNLSNSAAYFNNGNKSLNGTNSAYGASWTAGDVIGIALDVDNTTVTFYKNGTSQGNASTALASNAPLTFAGGVLKNSEKGSWNFGARPFTYTPPTGFKSLCTTNLPDPLVADGSTAFDAVLYTGNGGTKTVSGLDFEGDLFWFKSRSANHDHWLFDRVRGLTKALYSNSTSAGSDYSPNGISATSNTGFTFTSSGQTFNSNNNSYVGWVWDGGDLATTSDTTNYNQSQSFSAVTKAGSTSYSPTDSDTGFLNAYPTSNAFDSNGVSSVCYTNNNSVWIYVQLSTAIAVSSTIKFGARNTVEVKINGTDYSYTGGDSTATQNIRTISFSGSLTEFAIRDDDNSGYSTGLSFLEVDGKQLIDPGVIPVGGLNSSAYNQANWTGSTTATGIATNTGNDLASVFDGVLVNGTRAAVNGGTGTLQWTSGTIQGRVRVYLGIAGTQGLTYYNGSTSTTIASANNGWNDLGTIDLTRLDFVYSGGNITFVNAIELDGKILVQTGVTVTNVPAAVCTVRANPTAGFSIVKVHNPNSTESRAHGLNKKPDLIIGKALTGSQQWHIYHSALGKDYYGTFQTNNFASSDQWGSKEPDSNLFYVKTNTGSGANFAGGMIYYIWHAVDQYSAFGSYVGTGTSGDSAPFIYTGFKVAWLLIKNTSTSGETWTIHDSTRDVDNPAEHRLLPNSTNAETTGTSARFKDLLSNGFKIRGTSGEQNTSGDVYIYAAFASNPFKHARAR